MDLKINPFEPPNTEGSESDYSVLVAVSLAIIIGVFIIISG